MHFNCWLVIFCCFFIDCMENGYLTIQIVHDLDKKYGEEIAIRCETQAGLKGLFPLQSYFFREKYGATFRLRFSWFDPYFKIYHIQWWYIQIISPFRKKECYELSMRELLERSNAIIYSRRFQKSCKNSYFEIDGVPSALLEPINRAMFIHLETHNPYQFMEEPPDIESPLQKEECASSTSKKQELEELCPLSHLTLKFQLPPNQKKKARIASDRTSIPAPRTKPFK